MQNEKSMVYILKSKNDQMFKIGKSSDIKQRLSTLQKEYEFDLENSWTIEVPQKEVFKLENLLHFSFEKARIDDLPKASGYTEFFNISSLDDVLSFVNMISKYKSININKGICYLKNNSMQLKGEAWKEYLEVCKNKKIVESQRVLERFFRLIKKMSLNKNFIFTKKSKTCLIMTFCFKNKISDLIKFRKYNIKLQGEKKGVRPFFPISEYFITYEPAQIVYKIDIAVLFENEIIKNYERVYKKYIEEDPWK